MKDVEPKTREILKGATVHEGSPNAGAAPRSTGSKAIEPRPRILFARYRASVLE